MMIPAGSFMPDNEKFPDSCSSSDHYHVTDEIWDGKDETVIWGCTPGLDPLL
jgi:hypothetical protein